MTPREILALVVLTATILTIVLRPLGLNEGIAACLGALAMVALGWATIDDVLQAGRATSSILIFLIAMMIVATVVEAAGGFAWAADRAVSLARGDGRLLFFNLYVLGALVTVFLSLDVTAIMLAPIVCTLVNRAKLDPLPYVVACAFVANTASLFLPVSNLTNMLVYGLLGIPFWSFVRLMTLPNLVAMAINVVIFLMIFRGRIPARFDVGATRASLRAEDLAGTSEAFVVSSTVVGLVIVGLVIAGLLGRPLFPPALVGAVALTGAALARGYLDARRLARGVAWSLPFFVIGMDVVVIGADRAALGTLWTALVRSGGTGQSLGAILAIAGATAVGSNVVNNIPMSLMSIDVLGRVGAGQTIAFATVIGTNVGPNVTIFGSLATMLVLGAARRSGIRVGASEYLSIGLLATPPMVLGAALVLWIISRG